MGCSSSTAGQATAAKPVTAQLVQPVDARPAPQAPPAKRPQPGEFQIQLAGDWKSYEPEEDMVLKRAFLVGQPNAKFSLRGQHYEYSFSEMVQRNLSTNKERKIRPPRGMRAPKTALLPPGPMVVITVPKGAAGTSIEINDPNNHGRKLQVNVPPGAKPGQKMAVPVPEKGQTVEAVQKKQTSYSTGAKLAMGVGGVAAVAGLAVGGVILGDHLSGGAVADWAGEAFGDGAGGAVEAATAWTEGAVADAGEWLGGAAEDVGEWATGAGEDIGEFAGDAVDWLGDAAEDIGDFVMDLF